MRNWSLPLSDNLDHALRSRSTQESNAYCSSIIHLKSHQKAIIFFDVIISVPASKAAFALHLVLDSSPGSLGSISAIHSIPPKPPLANNTIQQKLPQKIHGPKTSYPKHLKNSGRLHRLQTQGSCNETQQDADCPQ